MSKDDRKRREYGNMVGLWGEKREVFLKNVSMITRTIKDGLAMIIPILFIGSMTVLLNSFPVQAYQDFLDSFLSGALRNIILIIQCTTVGILAIHITIALNISYMNKRETGKGTVFKFGSLLGCVTGFFILVGFFSGESDFSLLSGQGVFSALLAGLIGSVLFVKCETVFKTRKMVIVDGADSEFNEALCVVLPFLCVTLCFAVANYLITACFQVQSVQHLFMKAVDAIFIRMHRSYSSGLLFTFLLSVMWWFGIHGNNVLNQVAEEMFTTILPGEIVSKSFIDTFVNMGGTGCMIGLLFAMMIFGKRSSTKRLSGMAFFPGVFNLGELMVFGYPVIYNPMMIIPFIMAPALCFSNAFLLTKTGFLPPVTNSVVWTTPALLSGYLATGSVKGIVVQVMNILLSIACYSPFIIRCEKKSVDEISASLNELVDTFKKSEESGEEVILTECAGNTGRLAKFLASDLKTALVSSSLEVSKDSMDNPLWITYQPQYDSDQCCIGAASLVCWKHKGYGMIYPPIVIQLAKERGDLYGLETFIIERAIHDSESFRRHFGEGFKMSIKVTTSTFYDSRFVHFLHTMADRYRLKTGNICFVLIGETEKKETEELINKIRTYGYVFESTGFRLEQVDVLAVDKETLLSANGGIGKSS